MLRKLLVPVAVVVALAVAVFVGAGAYTWVTGQAHRTLATIGRLRAASDAYAAAHAPPPATQPDIQYARFAPTPRACFDRVIEALLAVGDPGAQPGGDPWTEPYPDGSGATRPYSAPIGAVEDCMRGADPATLAWAAERMHHVATHSVPFGVRLERSLLDDMDNDLRNGGVTTEQTRTWPIEPESSLRQAMRAINRDPSRLRAIGDECLPSCVSTVFGPDLTYFERMQLDTFFLERRIRHAATVRVSAAALAIASGADENSALSALVDPYSGAPLRTASHGAQRFVYAVGRNGADQQGTGDDVVVLLPMTQRSPSEARALVGSATIVADRALAPGSEGPLTAFCASSDATWAVFGNFAWRIAARGRTFWHELGAPTTLACSATGAAYWSATTREIVQVSEHYETESGSGWGQSTIEHPSEARVLADDEGDVYFVRDGAAVVAHLHPEEGVDLSIEVLARDRVAAIALSDTHVFLATQTAIRRAPRGDRRFTTIASATRPRALAVDGAYVYWESGGAIARASIAGGASEVLVVSGATSMSVDGGHLYFTTDHALVRHDLATREQVTLLEGLATPMVSIAFGRIFVLTHQREVFEWRPDDAPSAER